MASISIDFGDVVALAALAVASYSVVKTVQFNRRQEHFEETSKRLNLLLIERESKEALSQHRADISANFVDVGRRNHVLKVFNKGKATASDVRLEVLDDSGILMQSDIDTKFPVPVLEQHAYVELIGVMHMGSPRRAQIKLSWTDPDGSVRTKELFPSW